MEELLRASLPYAPLTLGWVLLLLLAPLTSRSMRMPFSIVLLAGAGALSVLAVLQAGATTHLEVINPFPRGPDGEVHLFVMDRVDAPAWQWPVVAAIGLALPALVLFLRRERRPQAPSPALFCGGLGLWILLVRLGLEKTAAPAGLVWGLGLTPSVVLMAIFAGGYAGSRGLGFGGLLAALFGMALIQRLGVSIASWFATMSSFGTHLDMGTLDDLSLPLLGTHVVADNPLKQWLWGAAIPQLTIWILATVVLGGLLGFVPWAIARRRAR